MVKPVRGNAESGSSATPQPVQRILQLDVLRGLAILLVLLHHTPFRLVYEKDANWFYSGYVAVQNLGWTGVDLFFVLSGFLVGGLLFKEIKHRGTLDVSRFIIRRGFKIWPSYYVYVIVTFIGLLKANDFSTVLKQMTPNLLHLQNYAKWTPCDFTWSLSIEEHFYLLVPLLLALVIRGRSAPIKEINVVPVIAIVLMVGCLALRIIAVGFDPFEFPEYKWQGTQYRVDSLFCGVLLAYLYYYAPDLLKKIGRHATVLLFIAMALLVPVHAFEFTGAKGLMTTFGFTLLYLAFGCTLIAFLYTPPGKGLLGRVINSVPARILAWLGIYSYSIYLWHLAFRNILYQNFLVLLLLVPAKLQWPLGMTIYLLGATLFGYGAAKAIEMPGLKLRDRLFPRREAIVDVAPPEA